MSPEEKYEELKHAYRTVMNTHEGRLVLKSILDHSELESNSAGISQFRTNETFFNQGKSAVGLDVKRNIEAFSPENLAKLYDQ